MFHPADDAILDYLNDDGQSIEPSWCGRGPVLLLLLDRAVRPADAHSLSRNRYIPVLPMVLVNGSDGIGTGWSSYIPNFNPADIVANLRRKLDGEDMQPMHPWYRGFKVRLSSRLPSPHLERRVR